MDIFLAMGPWQIILVLIILIVALVPTIIALVDIFKSQFDGNGKVIWVLVVILFGFVGAVMYFLIGRQQKLPKQDVE